MSSDKFYPTGFCQTIRCWLLNSLFSPNELRHILFKFFNPNISDAMPSHLFNFFIPNIFKAMPSKQNANQKLANLEDPGNLRLLS